MKLYVVSDTHGRRNFGIFKGKNGMFAHLGDCTSDAVAMADALGKPVVSVKGNCDFTDEFPLTETVFLGGKKILLVHGHIQQVKYSLSRLLYFALENGAACICYGHTHIPHIDYEQGVFMVCPGAFGRYGATYAVIDDQNGLNPSIVSEDNI